LRDHVFSWGLSLFLRDVDDEDDDEDEWDEDEDELG